MSIQSKIPPLEQQQAIFDMMQREIDLDLRDAGFEAVLERHELDASLGRLVVGRSFVYTTQEADVNLDLDPLASRMGAYRQVGLFQTTGNARSWHMIEVARSVMGSPYEPSEVGLELEDRQLAVVHESIRSFLNAKNDLPLTYLSTSFRRCEPGCSKAD